jgi:hypothetical protein
MITNVWAGKHVTMITTLGQTESTGFNAVRASELARPVERVFEDMSAHASWSVWHMHGVHGCIDI